MILPGDDVVDVVFVMAVGTESKCQRNERANFEFCQLHSACTPHVSLFSISYDGITVSVDDPY